MRIALVQVELRVGDFRNNTLQIIDNIKKAREKGADLVVFSELSVCGYPPHDLLFNKDFVDNCLESINTIARQCTDIAAVVGGPDPNTGCCGKKLFNAAFFLEDGKVTHIYHKGLLPDYDVFDEARYFEPASSFKTIPFKGKKIALTVCEDIWNVSGTKLYPNCPMDDLIKDNPDFIINISASPFAYDRVTERFSTIAENAKRYKLPLFYVNQIGAYDELIFDGSSSVFNSIGELVDVFAPFESGLKIYELATVNAQTRISAPAKAFYNNNYELIYNALINGIRSYFGKSGIKKAILGLSGGLDSALVLVLAAHALGKENVWAVLLPGPYSSVHSVKDALELANNLGVKHDVISINPIYDTLQSSLQPFFVNTLPDITEENLQARARAIILMGLSNKFGYMLLNTSNKSEAAVGYGTMYGDMAGGLSVIGDLYKTQAYDLARFINSDEEIIPQNIIVKPPSAELKPNQKDSDSLPEYEVLDQILYKYMEKQMSFSQIVDSGHDQELVARILHLVNSNEYKRYQAPPILRVSSKSFGPGRKMPLNARYQELS